MSSAEPVSEGGRSTTINDELVLAAGRGDSEVVKRLLADGADVTARCAPPLGEFNNGRAEVTKIDNDGGFVVRTVYYSGTFNPVDLARTALQAAAEGGYQDLVKLLMDAGADVNAQPAGYHGRTALQAAAEGGHQDLVKLLIDAEADFNAPPAWGNGRTALQAAAEGGHQDLVKLLVDSGTGVNAPPAGYYGRTALQAAAEGGHQDLVKLLMDAGADVNAPPVEYHGRTALQAAAGGGHQDLVKLLMGAEADVNALPAWGHGRTALQAAAGGGHQDLVKLLMDAGADVNAPSARYYGRTALQAAAEGGHQDLVKLLMDAGADVNARPAGYYGRTALQAAAGGGHQDLVKLLVDSGADVNAPPAGYYGRTALQAAARGGNQDLVKLLMDAGADVNARPAEVDGRTALQAAAEGGHQDLVKLLIDAGAEWSAALWAAVERPHKNALELLIGVGTGAPKKNNVGQTLLHKACQTGANILGLLLKWGVCNVNERDYFGSTIIHIAAKKGDRELVSMILAEGSISIDIKDNSGKTPLNVALDGGFVNIVNDLLDKGAITDGLRTDKLIGLLGGTQDNQDTILLSGKQTQQRSINMAYRNSTRLLRLSHLWPSIYLFGSVENPDTAENLADPCTYLKSLSYPSSMRGEVVVEWAWSTLNDEGGINGGFLKAIPSNQDILSLKPAKGVKSTENASRTSIEPFRFKTGKVEISWIMRESYGTRKKESDETPDEPGWQFLRSVVYRGALNLEYLSIPSHAVEFFGLFLDHIRDTWLELFEKAKIHLSEMRKTQLNSAGEDAKIISFLLNNSQQWSKLRVGLELHISKSKHLLSTFKVHDALYTELMDLGDDDGDGVDGDGDGDIRKPNVVTKSEGVIEKSQAITDNEEDIEGNGVIRMGGEDTGKSETIKKGTNDTQNHETTKKGRGGVNKPKKIEKGGEDIEGLEAIKELSSKIEAFSSECGRGISYLQEEIKEMIQLEFNLVSIYEARRSIIMSETSIKMAAASNRMSEMSIEMAAASNSTSMSMKRLSWITFIFLPLTFTTGLFGMNVNLLEHNPSWLWYISFVVPLFTLVLLFWILFKYVPIEKWIEDNIGSRLEPKRPDPKQTPPNGTPEELGSSGPEEQDPPVPANTDQKHSSRILSRGISFANFTGFLRRRQRDSHGDEENRAVPPTQTQPTIEK